MSATLERIRPGDVSEDERKQLENILRQIDRPRLISGEDCVELPQSIFDLLCDVVSAMRQGQTIVLLPEDEEVTTQQAANMLGISRTLLLREITAGKIPVRFAGSHRRISIGDLTAYRNQRDQNRRAALDELFDGIAQDGAYY
jgi:excisionase family DNA binding protein